LKSLILLSLEATYLSSFFPYLFLVLLSKFYVLQKIEPNPEKFLYQVKISHSILILAFLVNDVEAYWFSPKVDLIMYRYSFYNGNCCDN
jgi:hypothetical protein